MNTEHCYDPDFLSQEEADALFALAKCLPRERPLTKLSGFKYRLRRLQMPCYSATPNWRGSQNEETNQWMTPLDDTPAEVKSLAEKLRKLSGKPVNYFSFVFAPRCSIRVSFLSLPFRVLSKRAPRSEGATKKRRRMKCQTTRRPSRFISPIATIPKVCSCVNCVL